MRFRLRLRTGVAACAFAAAGTTVPVAIHAAQGAASTANVSVQVQPAHAAGSEVPTKRFFTVCVGIPGDLDKYGIQSTRSDGVANTFTNIPTGTTVVVTVEKSQYKSWQTTRTLTAGWSNHLQAGIQPGSGGPTCGTPGTPAAPAPPPPTTPPPPPVSVSGTPIYVADTPQLTEFTLNDNALVLGPGQYPVLQFKFTGPVTEVRVSEMSDTFPDPSAGWKPFVPPAQRPANGVYTLPLPTPTRLFATANPRETVYLQLRSGTKMSAIKSYAISVRATYTVSGGIFYSVAQSVFGFKVTGVNVPLPDQQCGMAVSGSTLTFKAPALGIAGECRYDVFTGGTLNAGWTFVRFTFNSSAGCASTITRTRPSSAASIEAQVRVPVQNLGSALTGCTGSLAGVTLEGPAGNVWQTSFSR